MAYLSREQFLSSAARLAEKDEPAPFFGGVVRIRELSGAQRMDARQAATILDGKGEPTDEIDEALYRAVVVQMGVVDPDTKEPLLSPDDVDDLAKHGREPLVALANAILQLSWMTPAALKSRDPESNAGQPDAGIGAETSEPISGGDDAERSGATDDGDAQPTANE